MLEKRMSRMAVIFGCIIGMFFLYCDNGMLFTDDNNEDDSDYLDPKDSSAVRAILDSNGLQNKQVRDVVDLFFGTVRSITLDSFPRTRFFLPKALDSCSLNLGVIITNSPVETLWVIDTIHQNLVITMQYTKLKSIPDCISLLRGQLALELRNNEISSISPEALKCDVIDADFRWNRLCSIPDSLKAWVAKKCGDDNWQKTQTCP